MKSSLHRCLKLISYTGLVLLVLFAVLLNVSRFIVLVMSHHVHEMESLVSQSISRPIRVGSVQAEWASLVPSITLNNVVINSHHKSGHPLLKIRAIDVRVNLFQSLLHGRFFPGKLTVRGVNLQLITHQSGQFSVQGLSQLPVTNQSVGSIYTSALWILQQSDVSLSDIHILWQTPEGKHHFYLDDFKHVRFMTAYRLRARLDGLNVDARFSHLDSDVGSLTAAINMYSDRLQLHRWFSHSLPHASLSAKVRITNNHQSWLFHVEKYFIRLGEIQTEGEASVWIPHQGSPHVNIVSEYYIDVMSHLTDYLPDALLSSGSMRWFHQAFQHGGFLADGTLLFRGSVEKFPFKDHDGHFSLMMHLRKLDMSYYKRWPMIHHVKGILSIKDNELSAKLEPFNVGKDHISRLTATISNLLHPMLTVNGAIDGNVPDTLSYFEDSPLKLGTFSRNVKAIGDLHAIVNFVMPLYETPLGYDLTGKVTLTNGVLGYGKSDLLLNKLSGTVYFDNNWLTINQLNGLFMGHPASVTLSTVPKPQTIASPSAKKKKPVMDHYQFELKTTLQIPRRITNLIKKQGVTVKGSTPIKLHATIHPSSSNPSVLATLDTSMKGITIHQSPEYFDKRKEDSMPIHGSLSFYDPHTMRAYFRCAKLMSAALVFSRKDAGFKLHSAEMYLGKGSAEYQYAPGFVISGRLASLHWEKWQPFVMAYIHTRNGVIELPTILGLPLRFVELHFSHLYAYDIAMNGLYYKLIPRTHDWMLNLQSPAVTGVFFFPRHSGGTWSGYFDQVRIPQAVLKKKKANIGSKFDPKSIPPLDLVINHLKLGERELGRFSVILRPEPFGLTLKKFRVQSYGDDLQAMGDWRVIHQHSFSHFKGNFTTNSLGDLLSRYHIDNVISGGKGQVAFDLHWPDSPMKVTLNGIVGKASVKFSHGRLLKTQGKVTMAELSTGRLINVLSLSSILSHLNFDFSDITKKGIKFDKLNTKLLMSKSILRVKSLLFDGPIVKITSKGLVDFREKKYDLRLDIMPYVTSSVPVIAGLIGGPVAGAVTWVANKLLTPKIGQLFGRQYHAKGAWGNKKSSKAVTLNNHNQQKDEK